MEHYLTPETTESEKQTISAFCFDLLEALNKADSNFNHPWEFPSACYGLCKNMDIWGKSSFYLGYNFLSCAPFNENSSYADEMIASRSFDNKERMEFVKYWAAKYVDKGE